MDFVKYDDASLFEKVKKARDTYISALKIANDTYKDSVAVAKKMYQRDFIDLVLKRGMPTKSMRFGCCEA